MNQIIFPEKLDNNRIVYDKELLKVRRKYIFLFSFSIVLLFIILIYIYGLLKVQKISDNILSAYDIQLLYSSTPSAKFPSIVSDSRRYC